MAVSLVGLLVCAGLLLLGLALRAPLVAALFASLPFGSTAIATFGGSSPTVFTLFAAALVAGVALSRGFANDLSGVVATIRSAPIVCTLSVYAVASAVLLPRLFAGWTSALVVDDGEIVEVPLEPSTGNITQTAYLVLGALSFLALCVLLSKRGQWRTIALGFLAFAAVHTALGAIDIGGKLVGAEDVLDPIRTASYALLVDTMEDGFWRIVGAYPEASTFAGYSLPCLAFAFTYWRLTRSRYALALALVLLLLLVFSTSSTAYASLAALALLLAGCLALATLRGELGISDLQILPIVWISLALGLCAYLYDDRIFDPFASLLDSMVFNKATSMSGQERAYWNATGMKAFLDTYGLGIGVGSSRTSSWPIAAISQLGVAGAAMMVLLLIELVRGIGRAGPLPMDREIEVLGRSARAAGIAWVVGSCVSGSSADPGMVFFLCLATVACCRERLAGLARSQCARSSPPARLQGSAPIVPAPCRGRPGRVQE